jgi:hypothetical protein
MIISLALLGYGASGTFLALTRKQWLTRFNTFYVGNAVAFAIASLVCYLLAQKVAINPEEMLWNWRQLLRLPALYLLLGLPFFFAANAVGIALADPRAQTTRIYAADLAGAAAGALGILGLLYVAHPPTCVRIISVSGFLSAILAWQTLKLKADSRLLSICAMALLVLILPNKWMRLSVSQFKGLPALLQIPGDQVVEERSSPLGFITVVESTKVPLRYAPGLSLNNTATPPMQVALFTDSEAMTAITHFWGDLSAIAYLDQTTSALAYHLQAIHKPLILCAGGGSDVLQARYHRADSITAVEINPQIVNLVRGRYAAFSGNLYNHPATQVHVTDARAFARSSSETFDLIQIAVPGSFGASAAGLYSLNEDFLFTIEAFQDYLQRISPGGFLSVTAWVKMPPRDSFKLFATAVEALKRSGVSDPSKRLAMIRSWQTSTLLVKNGEIATDEIGRIREFCDARSFDPCYFPGMQAQEAARFNLLE